MLGQAGVSEIRNTLEQKLTPNEARHLHLKYEEEGSLPAAAIVKVEGIELRLEKDHFDGCWTIATNEGTPRLLDRLEENQLGSTIVPMLEERVAQLKR